MITTQQVGQLIEFRRDLHRHPELGYQEHRTSAKVQEKLTEFGIDFVAGLAKGTGVLGYLPATQPGGRTVALRADMDALPILEQTGKPYSSANEGVMHACGHDGHTSVLVGVAQALSQSPERPNNVLFIFQPAEEGGAGGRAMCEDGVLNGKLLGTPADIIFGLHCNPQLRVGLLESRNGAMMAAADEFEIMIHGEGGHAAMPHLTVDPVMIGGHVITALQSIASRNISPLDSLVVTVTRLDAGTATNIIPGQARLVGTIRTLQEETRLFAHRRIEQIAQGVAAALGGTATVTIKTGYPVTRNDEAAYAQWRSIISNAFGAEHVGVCEPTMGAEDFSFYGHHVPACFYWVGVMPANREDYPTVHSPFFDFTDDALEIGVKAMCALAVHRE